ncbi:MAG TPA: hypothetical protein VGJ80_10185 [Gemmatimonadales bacterium]|jgi:hypothetical protein
MAKRVLLQCRDLFFRGKLQEIVRASGAELTLQEPYDIVVVELGSAGVDERIAELVKAGIPVLAFGSHVKGEQLRTARGLGARAVPNSEIEATLRRLLK